MKRSSMLAVAALALLSSVSVATAAGMSGSKADHSSMAQTKDKLSLTSQQRKSAWQDINTQASKETPPSGFSVKVGAAVPSSVATHPVPVSTSNDVPALRRYDYALLTNNKLLIVNPKDRKVAEIISQ